MHFYSTNKKAPKVTFREAALKGLAPDGGLYMPEQLPTLPAGCLIQSNKPSFAETAFMMVRPFVGNDIPETDLEAICQDAFSFPVKLSRITKNINTLELFWGPTFAFKDFGARFLARTIDYFARRENRHMTILVATSGDTGSAVAHGFSGMEAVDVVLLYPSGRVSPMQEKQLTTLSGNVSALEVKGTFDDCQSMVKQAFADDELQYHRPLSSANSINIGRLLPQSFYYVYAANQLEVSEASPVYICVPSGNFGNMTGALMAKKMGLPVKHVIVGTNSNDVVPQYLESGKFRPRPAIQTPASAMDVGNPSNFARILDLYDHSYDAIAEEITGYSFSDDRIYQIINDVQTEHGYLLDPHSAVGFGALSSYLSSVNDDGTGPAFFASTAHPGKFSEAILEATGQQIEIPAALAEAMNKEKQATLIDGKYEQLKQYLMY